MYSPTPADWHEANRAHWDERAPLHAAGAFFDLDAFRAGQDRAVFVAADVYDAATAVSDPPYDIVHTGVGVPTPQAGPARVPRTVRVCTGFC